MFIGWDCVHSIFHTQTMELAVVGVFVLAFLQLGKTTKIIQEVDWYTMEYAGKPYPVIPAPSSGYVSPYGEITHLYV